MSTTTHKRPNPGTPNPQNPQPLKKKLRQPSTPHEAALLQALEQAGFSNRRLILSTIRQYPTPPTLEQVKEHLEMQRIDDEEARMMDQARRESEQAESLRDHDEGPPPRTQWKALFPHSGLLDVPTDQTDQHYRLLQLEQRLERWYPQRCQAYLVHVLRPNVRSHPGQLAKYVQQLQEALSLLSHQEQGVPKILLEAHEKYGGVPDDEEDEVEHVVLVSKALHETIDLTDG